MLVQHQVVSHSFMKTLLLKDQRQPPKDTKVLYSPLSASGSRNKQTP